MYLLFEFCVDARILDVAAAAIKFEEAMGACYKGFASLSALIKEFGLVYNVVRVNA